VTDKVIAEHLSGKRIIGTYPLMQDDCCRFLAIDFDKSSWKEDCLAFLDACNELSVPAYLERSRSGAVDTSGFSLIIHYQRHWLVNLALI